MSARDYATKVLHEVEYQNLTCSELDYIDKFLEEMRDCPPEARPAFPRSPGAARLCPAPENTTNLPRMLPVYTMTPEMYDSFGPTLKATLKDLNGYRLMDVESMNDERPNGPAPPLPQVRSVLGKVQGEIRTAQSLRNCGIN